MANQIPPLSVANLFRNLPNGDADEQFLTIIERSGLRVERIVSQGHSTPEDQPYDQPDDEWVLLVEGAARLWIEEQGEVSLAPGDHLLIPARRRHRVVWTTPDGPTVWLAVHFGAEAPSPL
jgi:cupin 2 domain-containing protein